MEMKINSIYLANNTKEKEQLVAVAIHEWATWALEVATMTQMYLLETRLSSSSQCLLQDRIREVTNTCMEHLAMEQIIITRI